MDDIIGQDEDGIYAIFSKEALLLRGSKSAYLARINADLDVEVLIEPDLSLEKEKLNFEHITLAKGKLLLFASNLDKSGGTRTLYVRELNKATLEPATDNRQIAEITFDKSKEAKSTGFQIKKSSDGSKIMVYYNTPFSKKGAESFGIHMFDASLNELWSKEVELPYEDALFAIGNKSVAPDGSVYIAGTVLKDKKDRSKDEPDGQQIILGITADNAEIKEYPLDMDDNFINSLIIRANDKGELICGGFLRDSRHTGTSGAFFARIDLETKDVTHRSVQNFTPEFIAQDLKGGASKKTLNRADKGKSIGISRMLTRSLIQREDGGIMLTGEQYHVSTTTTTTANGGTVTKYTYHYNDIVVVSISPEGNIKWAEKIPKRQATVNDGGKFSSYTQLIKNDKVYFIFNDDPKNLMYKGYGKLKPMKLNKAFVTLVEVDDDGRVFRENLLGSKLKGVIAMPKASGQLSADELLLYAERGSKKNMMKVKFLR